MHLFVENLVSDQFTEDVFQMGVIWQGTKTALFCGAAYTLAKADVWGDNKATIQYVTSKIDSCDK